MRKPRTCQKCGSATLKRRSTTYPIELKGRRIDVQRVKLDECGDCGFLMPTPEGHAKIQRCTQIVVHALLNTSP